MATEEELGIILRFTESGEKFFSLAFLSRTRGLLYPLLRRSKTASRPDLFDTANVKLAEARQGSLIFASEYSPTHRRTGIAHSYKNLTLASRFAEIVRANVQHLPDHEIIFDLSEQLFDALEIGLSPEAAYLKTLYLFAKTEGLPVKEDWVSELGNDRKEALARVLKTPLAGQDPQFDLFADLIQSFERWLAEEAHFIIPTKAGR